MKLSDLKLRTQIYLRDTKGNKFTPEVLTSVIYEAVDRIRNYSVFKNMPYPDDLTNVQLLPDEYHYLIAVYASSRLFELDNDYYQATQSRTPWKSVEKHQL